MSKRAFLAVIALWLAGVAGGHAQNRVWTETEVMALLQECVDKQHRAPGMVVGLVSDSGTKVFAYGRRENDKPEPVDGNSIFEIGSITKVFTTTLLQVMADRGEVRLDDRVVTCLPASVTVPSKNGKEITLYNLATQRSSLPSLPFNLKLADQANPYANYTVEELYAFLSRFTSLIEPGEKYEDSNLGLGLLGHVLAIKAGMDYETAIKKNICQPLKMNDTGIAVAPAVRMATGHNRVSMPVKNWDFPVLSGAGALRSSANDLAKFLAANLGIGKTPLTASMQKTHEARETANDQKIGLGWNVAPAGGLVWHNGATGGYRSFLALNKEKRSGVVVLSNSENEIDDIGQYLIGARAKPANFTPIKQHKVVKIDYKVYDQYVGQYQLGASTFTITREGDRLMAQLTRQGTNEILPESEKDFFYTVVDAQLTFVKDRTGKVTHLILHQGEQDQTAQKIK